MLAARGLALSNSRKPAKSKITVTRHVKRELKHMTKLRGASNVKVGLPSGSGAYPDGTDVVSVGFWNEFGTKFAPERSWMRTSIRGNAQKYRRLNRSNLKKIQQQKLSLRSAMSRLGQQARDDMIESIENFTSPALAASTIAARKRRSQGSSRPLEDTGLMKQSITFEVL